MAKKKSKSKKKKATAPGVDLNEQRRERLESRRRAKAEAQAQAFKAERRRKLMNRTVLVAALGAAAWFFFLRPSGPAEIQGHPISTFSGSGVGDHTSDDVDYESSPPVSGFHDPAPAGCGVFAEPIDNEMQVHSLEHGVVGIQYDPNEVPPEDIAAIEDIVREYDSHVFSAPYPEMDHFIAVTSWDRMMPLDELDEGAIREYIDTFRDKGPEGGKECDTSSDQPFGPEPSASPSPSA